MNENFFMETIINNSFSTFVALYCLYKIDKTLIDLSLNVKNTNSTLSLLFKYFIKENK